MRFRGPRSFRGSRGYRSRYREESSSRRRSPSPKRSESTSDKGKREENQPHRHRHSSSSERKRKREGTPPARKPSPKRKSPKRHPSRSRSASPQDGHRSRKAQSPSTSQSSKKTREREKSPEHGKPVFRGREGEEVDRKELRKITISIQRNVPRSSSPVVRRLINPEDLIIVRQPGEGSRPIFDRPELQGASGKQPSEERQVQVIRRISPDVYPRDMRDLHKGQFMDDFRKKRRSRSRSPFVREGRERHSRQELEREEWQPGGIPHKSFGPPVHFRERDQDYGHLDREMDLRDGLKRQFSRERRRSPSPGFAGRRLERDSSPPISPLPPHLRPQFKPWEFNPELVPRGRSYFEHDRRDSAYSPEGSSRGRGRRFFGSRFRSSRGFRGSQYRGSRSFRGGYSPPSRGRFYPRDDRRPSSPREWRHDMFENRDIAGS